MTKFERISLITALIAIVISLASGIFTFWQWLESNKESIEIEISHPEANYPTKIEIYRTDTSETQMLPVYFKCTVINLGDKKVTLTKFLQVEVIDSSSTDSSFTYTVAYGNSLTNRGFYENFDKQIYLPIDIDANSSKSFYIKVGVDTKIDSSYWRYDNIRDLKAALLGNCRDIFGNKIGMYFQDDYMAANRRCLTDSSLSYPTHKNAPYYKVEFTTSKKTLITTMMYWYRPEGK